MASFQLPRFGEKGREEIVNNDGTFLITLGWHRRRKSSNRPHTSSTARHSSKIITRTLTNASVSRQRDFFRPLLLAWSCAWYIFLPKWANDRLTISRVIDFHLARDSLISMIYYEVKCAAFISGVENPKETSGLARENLLQDLRLHFIKCEFSEFSKLYKGSNLNKEISLLLPCRSG